MIVIPFAHGIVGKRDLPIPDYVFGWAAGVVLVLSFVGLAVLWPKPILQPEPARRLCRFPGVLVDVVCGIIGVAVFVAVVYAGFAGVQSAEANLAPTFVYVTFWVGLAFASLLFGNVFGAFNPWRAVARAVSWLFARSGREAAQAFPYPERLGHWPAAAGILAFTMMELVVDVGADPRPLAIAALVYSAATWFCMSLYGVERWCDRGEAFSVYFGLFSRLSVFERRGSEIGRRPFLAGLAGFTPLPGTVPLIAVMIGSTSFDGLSVGSLWRQDIQPKFIDLFEGLGFAVRTAIQLADGLGLLMMILAVFGFYRLGILGVRTAGGDLSAGALARAFAHSLVPIAVAYVLAHYISLLLIQMQAVPALLSDPLGRGSDIFGAADWSVDTNWVSPEALWYMQVGFVVSGHVAALALAHDRALALYDRASVAVRSQYWMLAVMVGFTCLALWLLSEVAQG